MTPKELEEMGANHLGNTYHLNLPGMDIVEAQEDSINPWDGPPISHSGGFKISLAKLGKKTRTESLIISTDRRSSWTRRIHGNPKILGSISPWLLTNVPSTRNLGTD